MVSISLFIIAHLQNPFFLDWMDRYAEARENEHLVCSSVSGFHYYHKSGIAESIGKPASDAIFVIGTIKSVETKAVDQYRAVHRVVNHGNYSDLEVVGYEPTGDKIPWKFVTLDVEKYLLDGTGNYYPSAKEITFRTAANACVDNSTGEIVSLPSSFASDPASDPDKSPKYNVGDRSLIEIHRLDNGELDATGNLKLDIDENSFVKPDYRRGIDKPVRIEDLEKEIAAEIEKLK